jgi:hypothetical protein
MELRALLNELAQSEERLRRVRNEDAVANSLFEAADDLIGLGRLAVDCDTRVDYPRRAAEERDRWKHLASSCRVANADEQQRLERLCDTAGEVLRILGSIQPPAGGHLGFLGVIRGRFGFLSSTYGFVVLDEHPARVELTSGNVRVVVTCSPTALDSFTIRRESHQDELFWIADVLFLRGDPEYRKLDELKLDSAGRVNEWFGRLSTILLTSGDSLLRGTRLPS